MYLLICSYWQRFDFGYEANWGLAFGGPASRQSSFCPFSFALNAPFISYDRHFESQSHQRGIRLFIWPVSSMVINKTTYSLHSTLTVTRKICLHYKKGVYALYCIVVKVDIVSAYNAVLNDKYRVFIVMKALHINFNVLEKRGFRATVQLPSYNDGSSDCLI